MFSRNLHHAPYTNMLPFPPLKSLNQDLNLPPFDIPQPRLESRWVLEAQRIPHQPDLRKDKNASFGW